METKPCNTQEELSLAYTPGVASPSIEIKDNPEDIWKYTARGNSVAVVTDGSAVLGLGNIGAGAALPVMEGKCVLFKKFAGIDAYPVCLQNVNAEKIIGTVRQLEPTFGGINLEDIKAPECFEIEQALKKELSIPVFHDDQHGTAIISLAGLLNGLEMAGKKIGEIGVVFSGAGAAGIACARYYESAGVAHDNITLVDSKGIVYTGRENLNPEKEYFAQDTEKRTLADAMQGADVFVGVSVGGIVTKDMVRSMAEKSILYPMANPTPEIFPDEAKEAGAYIVGTGRSDYPNQINNVLGFPGIFRGALDVRASDVNEDMKRAASRALAEIVKEKVPENVKELLLRAYPEDGKAGMFEGDSPLKQDYVIPKALDPRVVPRVARCVAEAAMNSGVAKIKIDDLEAYEKEVARRVE
jgi:malate dehydrogenase (oxaloacetate-decarboxylating)(NADP+)